MIKSSVDKKGIKMPPRYEEEFKRDAVRQVINNGYSVVETATRLGVHPTSLSNWIKKYKNPQTEFQSQVSEDAQAEIKRLQKELKRVSEERLYEINCE